MLVDVGNHRHIGDAIFGPTAYVLIKHNQLACISISYLTYPEMDFLWAVAFYSMSGYLCLLTDVRIVLQKTDELKEVSS